MHTCSYCPYMTYNASGISNHVNSTHSDLIGVRISRLFKEKQRNTLKEQRKNDLKAISFHFAIPLEDLQKALDSKIPSQDIDLEVPESVGGD